MRPKLEGQDIKNLEHALLNYWDKDEFIGIYYVLPDRLLSTLEISDLNPRMLHRIIKGLCGDPKNTFEYLSVEELQDPARCQRFALFNNLEIKKAVRSGLISHELIAYLASDAQFKELDFSKIRFYDMFPSLPPPEMLPRLRHLMQLIPNQVELAVREGRFNQVTADQYLKS
jgi:hypothetical protein